MQNSLDTAECLQLNSGQTHRLLFAKTHIFCNLSYFQQALTHTPHIFRFSASSWIWLFAIAECLFRFKAKLSAVNVKFDLENLCWYAAKLLQHKTHSSGSRLARQTDRFLQCQRNFNLFVLGGSRIFLWISS